MNQPDTWENPFQATIDAYFKQYKEDYERVCLVAVKGGYLCPKDPSLKSFEQERATWLRSEIEKLEGETKGLVTLNCYGNCNPRCHDSGKDIALTTIITRYKEELKVLESK